MGQSAGAHARWSPPELPECHLPSCLDTADRGGYGRLNQPPAPGRALAILERRGSGLADRRRVHRGGVTIECSISETTWRSRGDSFNVSSEIVGHGSLWGKAEARRAVR
jgi:hypothetical protein